MKLYVEHILDCECLTLVIRARPLVEIAELVEKLVVRRSEFQLVQSVASFRRELNRRDLRDTFCRGGSPAHIVLLAHIELCVVNPEDTARPFTYGLPNVNGTDASKRDVSP